MRELLSTKNLLTFAVAVLSVWIAFAGLGGMLGARQSDFSFPFYLSLAIPSYVGGIAFVLALLRILRNMFVIPRFVLELLWIPVLVSGSIFFSLMLSRFIPAAGAFILPIVAIAFTPAFLLRVIWGVISVALSKQTPSLLSLNGNRSDLRAHPRDQHGGEDFSDR